MPVTVEEKFGRVLSDESAELTFIVRGTNSDTTARSQLLIASPTTHNSLQRDDVEVEEISPDIWLGVVRYVSQEGSEPVDGEQAFSFETRGGTQHITQSLSTPGSYAPVGQTAPDFDGAIGVTANGIDGVDITVPVFTFNTTFYLDNLTQGYVQTLFNLTGCVNDGGFTATIQSGVSIAFAGGEVLFLGAAGTRRGQNPWELNLALAASPNIENLTLGDITGIDKQGWDYLWLRYHEAEDTDAKVLIRKPIAAYVERVYRRADLTALNP